MSYCLPPFPFKSLYIFTFVQIATTAPMRRRKYAPAAHVARSSSCVPAQGGAYQTGGDAMERRIVAGTILATSRAVPVIV